MLASRSGTTCNSASPRIPDSLAPARRLRLGFRDDGYVCWFSVSCRRAGRRSRPRTRRAPATTAAGRPASASRVAMPRVLMPSGRVRGTTRSSSIRTAGRGACTSCGFCAAFCCGADSSGRGLAGRSSRRGAIAASTVCCGACTDSASTTAATDGSGRAGVSSRRTRAMLRAAGSPLADVHFDGHVEGFRRAVVDRQAQVVEVGRPQQPSADVLALSFGQVGRSRACRAARRSWHRAPLRRR